MPLWGVKGHTSTTYILNIAQPLHCKILSSNSGEYEADILLRYSSVQSCWSRHISEVRTASIIIRRPIPEGCHLQLLHCSTLCDILGLHNWVPQTRGSQTVERALPWAVPLVFWGHELMVWTFIFNEIRAQGKIYILVNTLLGWNILLIAWYRYWLRNVSSTFCCRLNLEKHVIR
jgi:hypothetical protein